MTTYKIPLENIILIYYRQLFYEEQIYSKKEKITMRISLICDKLDVDFYQVAEVSQIGTIKPQKISRHIREESYIEFYEKIYDEVVKMYMDIYNKEQEKIKRYENSKSFNWSNYIEGKDYEY